MESSLKITPYLYFNGNCEEALNFYSEVFSGILDRIERYATAPMPVPEDYKNKVMHARLSMGNDSLMFCDVFPGESIRTSGNIELTILPTSEEEARSIFNRLAEGGNIVMPLEMQFWGALYGKVQDKFGIKWMVNYETGEGG
jgi:PhnB protein